MTPHECLPVFRRQGILHQVGDGVRERAASQAAAWHRQGLMSGHISVNVSAAELCHPALPGKIEDLLDRYQIQLELELTESELIHDDLRARSALARLRALGVRIAVDDFGSGFSSLQRIRTLPFDVLKVDRVFVSNLEFSSRDRAIVAAMVQLTDRMGADLVAEGVENDSQRRALVDLGVKYAQGFGLCNPLLAHNFEEWCLARNEAGPAVPFERAG